LPPSPPPPPPTSFALTGRVTDATTSLPIGDALVEAFDAESISRSATSDVTGAYRIGGLKTAGYTVRVRRSGYDSAFRGVGINGADTSADFQLARIMTTLAGTWTGFLEYSPATGPRQHVTILTAPLTQSGASFSSGATLDVHFSGTLQDPSAIGSTTGIAGTLMMSTITSVGRSGATFCDGTTAFTGTTNWTRMSMTAPQITFDCAAGLTYTNVVVQLDKQQ